MKSDLFAARQHLEKAFDCLSGDDELGRRAREALGIILDAIAVVEHRRPTAEIIAFPQAASVLATRGLGSSER
ncbi:hypothetical protein [Arvimicrobium flavum]|uniref:hypothetical protein n=1 Tax=Arvimicrobium flavum TaxID=3393320 RepID=UPI00237C1BE5|nr:hypothetical protein [Mesorhizobium shangrilense]